MLTISNRNSILRTPSSGELIFLAMIVVIFLVQSPLDQRLPFAPYDWFQQHNTAQINARAYAGDGIVVTIDEETFATIDRNAWTRSDLAEVVDALGAAEPAMVLIDRQYFAASDQASDQSGVEDLRASLGSIEAPVYWEVELTAEEYGDLLDNDLSPSERRGAAQSARVDPGALGIAQPTAMSLAAPALFAPLFSWYSITVDGTVLPSSGQVLSNGNAPASNRYDVDLSYNPATVPALSAARLIDGDFDPADIRGKRVVIAFFDNMARDSIQTPGSLYTSRGAAALMAAETLNRGPPLRIGWYAAFAVAVMGALAWVFLRRPLGRWVALGVFVLVVLSPLFLERLLIFQATSQGVFLLIILAIGKVWMRGREAVRTYRSAAETKSRFLAQASHDLRQPIHAIGLLSERLSQTDLSPDQAEIVSKISWSVGNASRMFRSLLDIAAIESGTLRARKGPVSINELLAEIDSQNGLVAEQANVDLRLVPSNLVVNTDRALIGTMLQNLVSNAIKYSSGKSVVVGCKRRGDRVALLVVDDGRGISEDDLKHVKKEFYRASQTSTLDSDNKGLGLAIVNRLATMLGLSFSLSSALAKGTTASIEGLEPVTEQAEPERQRAPGTLPLAGLKVVVADDDQETLRSTASLLENWGCDVSPFDHFPKEQPSCDVLLSDFDFGNDGTLAEHMPNLSHFVDRGTPVIVISGHHPDQVRNEMGENAKIILSKPLRAAELRSAIMSVRMN